LLQAGAPEASGTGVTAAFSNLPSSVAEAIVLEALLNVSTRFEPDCEMPRGPLASEESSLPQDCALEPAALASIFQMPSTEIGARRLRPVLSTPARPSNGKPTSRTYATTKLRLVCDIVAFSLFRAASGAALTSNRQLTP
jgi:hypothetical protein